MDQRKNGINVKIWAHPIFSGVRHKVLPAHPIFSGASLINYYIWVRRKKMRDSNIKETM